MASKRNLRRKQCRGKYPYNGKDDPKAQYDLEQLTQRTGHEFEIYSCSHCGKFHIGHKEGYNAIANTAKIEFGFNKGRRLKRHHRPRVP